MNQTANYQLNQWQTTDRILMSDFNADNQKLDAVIRAETDRVAALPHGTLLCGGVTEAEANQVDLDVTDVDWSQYLLALLEVQTPEPWQMRVYINGGASSKCAHGHLGTTGYSTNELGFIGSKELETFSEIIIPVLYRGDHGFHAINASSEGTFGVCSMPLNELSALTLAPRAWDPWTYIPAGTVFRLWGVR